MKSVLITGVAGFIGYNLAKTLLEKNESVIGIDNFITGQPQHIATLLKFPHFSFLKHDIIQPFPKLTANSYNLPAGKAGLKTIFHLACPTGVPNLTRMGEEMLLTSSFGTKNILELARHYNAQLLFTSSSEIYGNPTVSPQKESYTGSVDPTGIRSTYEEGKRFAEALVSFYGRKYKLLTTTVRLFNVYGPGMSVSETRVIPRFISQSLTNKPLTVHGDGSQTRTFCYSDDIVRGLLLIAEKGKPGQVYNLGSNQQISMKELAVLIKQITNNQSPISFVHRPSHDHDSRCPDLTKIHHLGWGQTVGLKEGLRRTVEYFKALKQ